MYEYQYGIKKYCLSKIFSYRNNMYRVIINHNHERFERNFYTKQEADNFLYQERCKIFEHSIKNFGLNPCDGKLIYNKYIAFPNGEIFNLYGKRMIGMIDRCGYREIILNKKSRLVHRVIAMAFLPHENKIKNCVNHKDGNKLNNNIDNLEWCTHSENTIHAYQNHLENPVYGEQHGKHKLTNEQIVYIRTHYIRRDKQYSFAALAKKFNVDLSTIRNAYYNKTWRHINVKN